jgi:hypothetical protein
VFFRRVLVRDASVPSTRRFFAPVPSRALPQKIEMRTRWMHTINMDNLQCSTTGQLVQTGREPSPVACNPMDNLSVDIVCKILVHVPQSIAVCREYRGLLGDHVYAAEMMVLEVGVAEALYYAVEGSSVDVVRHIIAAWSPDQAAINNALIIVAEDDIDPAARARIARLLLDAGATDRNLAMVAAAAAGHMDMVRLMLDAGANDCEAALVRAADSGHADLVRFLLVERHRVPSEPIYIAFCMTPYDYALSQAAWSGHIDVVRLLLDAIRDEYPGVPFYLLAMEHAAQRGYLDFIAHAQIVRLIMDRRPRPADATDEYMWIRRVAAQCGHHDIVRLLQYQPDSD